MSAKTKRAFKMNDPRFFVASLESLNRFCSNYEKFESSLTNSQTTFADNIEGVFEVKMKPSHLNKGFKFELSPEIVKLPLYNSKNEPVLAHPPLTSDSSKNGFLEQSLDRLVQEKESKLAGQSVKKSEKDGNKVNRFNSFSYNGLTRKNSRYKNLLATEVVKPKRYKCEHCKLEVKTKDISQEILVGKRMLNRNSTFNENDHRCLHHDVDDTIVEEIEQSNDHHVVHTVIDKIASRVETSRTMKPKSGRWSPIKLPSAKVPRLHEKLKANDRFDLNQAFKHLDRDQDGHVNFDLIQNKYLFNMNQSEDSFFHQLYFIMSEMTFFGIKEFRAYIVIVESYQKYQKSVYAQYWENFLATDFDDYKFEMREYIRLIDRLDFSKDLIVEDVLRARLANNFDKLKESSMRLGNQMRQLINGETIEAKIINYILLIPLFINFECLLNNKKILKRHRNSILDMKEALNFHNFLKKN